MALEGIVLRGRPIMWRWVRVDRVDDQIGTRKFSSSDFRMNAVSNYIYIVHAISAASPHSVVFVFSAERG